MKSDNTDLLRAEARKCRYFAEAISDADARDELLRLAADYYDRAALLEAEAAVQLSQANAGAKASRRSGR